MKQIKISSFFAKDGAKRKVPEDGEAPVPSVSSQKPKKDTKKKKTDGKVKSKTDKENGFQNLLSVFTVNTQSQSQKAVLSPKKLEENVRVKSPKKELIDEFDGLFDEADWGEEKEDDDAWHAKESELSFRTPIRCEVLRTMFSNHPRCEQIVLVRAEGSEKEGTCRLRDMWTFMSLNVNDKVTVKAHEIDGHWVVNSQNGYLVLHPDMLMPITSLVGGMYCLRRGVLSHLYRNLKPNLKVMIMGRVLHDLLQESLRRNLDTEDGIGRAAEEIVKSKSYLREFYLNDIKLDAALKEVIGFVPKVQNFNNVYLKGGTPMNSRNFQGQIVDVMDIEEAVSSSCFGVQGRVDVTVKVQKNNKKRIMPLELKMGRASFSKEHKIQVIMYTLLLDEMLRNVESGLLLYLREELIEEVKPDFGEVRNLLMLRNEFVRHLKNENYHTLPDPIRSKACKDCAYARVCLAYIKHDGLDSLPASHPLREIDFPDLKQSHVEYFINWSKMLFLECSVEECAVDGLMLSNDEDVTQIGAYFKHVFKVPEKDGNMRPGLLVTVQNGNQTVSRGKVDDVSNESITILLDKKLSKSVYKLTSTNQYFLQNYLTNLSFFLEGDYERLRELVIDKAPPNNDHKIVKSMLNEETVDLLKHLNTEQQRAVLQAVASNEYLLIKGPPGTGKTETIVSLIKFLYLQNQKVLITGHTNASIDHILKKLDGLDYIRFGSLSSINKQIHKRSFHNLLEQCTNMDDVKKLYDTKIMASTCIGLDLEMISKVSFDVCIIDEGSQVMQIECVRPLLFSKKFILIGDPHQLPPVVKSHSARVLGMDVSLFERLDSEVATVCLAKQYRMNRVLNKLANDLTYNGLLRCGNDAVANATLDVGVVEKPWMRKVLSAEMDMSVVFVDTSEYFDGQSDTAASRKNKIEAGVVYLLLRELIDRGVSADDVGVITPYVSQLQLLSRTLQRVEVSTVDQFQGRDKKVVFFSCTKHNRTDAPVNSSHILNDHRRLNVAVTRAKVKLIVVGDVKSMAAYPSMSKLISCMSAEQIIKLQDGVDEFFWNDLLNLSVFVEI